MISHITYEERKGGKFLKELTFPISSILKFYKETGIEKSKDLKERLIHSIEEIKTKKISLPYIDQEGKEKYKDYPWYENIEFEDKTKKFIFKFNHDLLKLLLDIKNYFKSNLKEFLSLKSSYAINLYLFFKAQSFIKKAQRHNVEDLKKYLQVEQKDSYCHWSSFKRSVLDIAFEQLSKHSQYFFEYTFKKEGYKVNFITVFMIDKEDKKEYQKYILRKIRTHLKSKKLEEYFEEFKKMHFLHDTKKDLFEIHISKTDYNKDKIAKLDDFIIKNELAKSVFKKFIFTKNTKVTYKLI